MPKSCIQKYKPLEIETVNRMKDYFRLQFTMTSRKIREMGIHPFLGYFFGIITFFLLSEYVFRQTTFAKYVVILICIGLQFNFAEKNRTEFLLVTFGDKIKKEIRILENFTVCLPFVSILLYKNFPFEASLLLFCSVSLALFSFHSTFHVIIPTPISKRPFEFTTGFRKTIFIYAFAYVLTVISIAVGNLNLGIFALLFLFLTYSSYYQKPEQDYFVWVHADTPKKFLKNKILNASQNAIILSTPVLFSLLVFFPRQFDFIFLIFLIGLLFLWTIVLAKYAAYPREMNLQEGILIALCLYFPPFLLAIFLFFYVNSIKKLTRILND
jgi:hypothetical protein